MKVPHCSCSLLSLDELKRPIDTSDDRDIALHSKDLDCIAQAISDQDVFLCETEGHRVFSESVNECHKWLTSCPCHDHI